MMEIKRQRRATAGFTLVEMLVVIAIIGLLAALTLGGAKIAAVYKIKKRVTAEMHAIQTAIDSYHAKLGFYPPDGKDAAKPPLFYELAGTKWDKQNSQYLTIEGDATISTNLINTAFGHSGFANSNPEEAQNFLPILRGSQFTNINNVTLLTVPTQGTDPSVPNTWHYTTGKRSNPPDDPLTATNNPDSYDLWAEVVIGGKVEIIGNWKTK